MRNVVTSEVLEREGRFYLRVRSVTPAGTPDYDQCVLVDGNPNLHALLLLHRWSLGATGHLLTQAPRAQLLESIPTSQRRGVYSLTLARCIAILAAGKRPIKSVRASPLDARLASIAVLYEPEAIAPVVLEQAAPGTAVMVSELQPAREVTLSRAEENRQAAEQRRKSAERERFADKLHKAAQRADTTQLKETRAILKRGCEIRALELWMAARKNGEAWAQVHLDTRHPDTPANVLRLAAGKPELIPLGEAMVEHAERYQASENAFFLWRNSVKLDHTFPVKLLRRLWLERYPQHDWTEWDDSGVDSAQGNDDEQGAHFQGNES